MNPKSALLISAALTAFVGAILFGVITRVNNNNSQAAALAPATAAPVTAAAAPVDQTVNQSQPTVQVPLSYDEAATLAAKAINRTDVYSVEASTYQGAQSFKVTFSSGDVVYIGLDRQVLATSTIQPAIASVVTMATPESTSKHKSSSKTSTFTSPSKSVEPETEHETEHEGE